MDLRSPAACLILAATLVASLPTGEKTQDTAFWKETPMDGTVQELEMKCGKKNDPVSCLKFKVLSLLDEIFRKDSYKVSTMNRVLAVLQIIRTLLQVQRIEYLTQRDSHQ
jgi:hypothetical protein